MTVKRAPWFIVTGAIAGFAGIAAFHVGAAAPVPGASTSTGAPRSPGVSGSPGSPGGSGSPSASSPVAAGAGASGSGASGSAPASGGRAHTATGPDVNFSYGTIAVSVTVRGSRIVDVSVAAIHVFEPESGQISGQAIPVLRGEVLDAQSASVHSVSGATYTSRGYISSLNAALNHLHTRRGA
jgi:FMN-binding domain